MRTDAGGPSHGPQQGAELGAGQVKKYDIECWMPSRGAYGETHSCSMFCEFQARRLKLRYRTTEGKTLFAHTLNNTLVHEALCSAKHCRTPINNAWERMLAEWQQHVVAHLLLLPIMDFGFLDAQRSRSRTVYDEALASDEAVTVDKD